ncbi:uncharacterized protein [Hetaerina americana]|uniref:uncharacterized protein n=1 Tax=Hetaerina americana TaxID=62018 RepID=UPI003A7F409F
MHLKVEREAQEGAALDGALSGGRAGGPDVGAILPAAPTATATTAVAASAATSTATISPAAAVTSSPEVAAAAAGVAGGGASSSGNTSSLNVTDHFLDEESEDNGFSEMQTVALACIATLIPLFIILVAAFAIRFLWRKFRPRNAGEGDGEAVGAGGVGGGYDGVLHREGSGEGAKADAVGGASGNGAHLLLLMPDELKTSESQFSVTPGELDDVTSQSPLIGGSASGKGGLSTVSNHKGVGTSKSANGSVITMTLQNNHLIVETEELASLPMVDEGEPSPPHAVSSSVEDTAQIHQPPPCTEFRRAAPEDDLLDDDEELVGDLEGIAEEDEDEVAAAEREEEAAARGRKEPTGAAALAAVDSDVDEDDEVVEGAAKGAEEDGGQAGLSQSDLSESSSIASANPTYRYGNQLGYASGHFGYPQYAGYDPPKASTSAASGEEDGGPPRRPGAYDGDDRLWRSGEGPANGEGGDEEEEEEKRHQRVQEQLGGGSAGGGHHRTGSLPKAAADDSAASLGGGMSETDRFKCSKRRSLPIITHAPSAALGGFKKLLNEDDEGGGGTKKKAKDILKELPDGELEVAEEAEAAPASLGGSDGAALSSGGAGTNSGEHENEAFVETD